MIVTYRITQLAAREGRLPPSLLFAPIRPSRVGFDHEARANVLPKAGSDVS